MKRNLSRACAANSTCNHGLAALSLVRPFRPAYTTGDASGDAGTRTLADVTVITFNCLWPTPQKSFGTRRP